MVYLQVYLSGPKVYSCSNCRTHLSTDDDVISRVSHSSPITYHNDVIQSSNEFDSIIVFLC